MVIYIYILIYIFVYKRSLLTWPFFTRIYFSIRICDRVLIVLSRWPFTCIDIYICILSVTHKVASYLCGSNFGWNFSNQPVDSLCIEWNEGTIFLHFIFYPTFYDLSTICLKMVNHTFLLKTEISFARLSYFKVAITGFSCDTNNFIWNAHMTH